MMKFSIILMFIFLNSACAPKVTDHHKDADFIGSWKLEKWTAILEDGTEVYPYGKAAYGKITYEENGEMSALFMSDDRQKMSSDNVSDRIAEEALAAFNTFFAYAGPYEINRDSSFVIHKVEACINPNWVGRHQKRFFQIVQNQLILSTPPIEVQGTQSQSVSQILIWNKNL